MIIVKTLGFNGENFQRKKTAKMQLIFKIQLAIFLIAVLIAIGVAFWLIGIQQKNSPEPEIILAPAAIDMEISSPVFKDGKFIPPKYACGGVNPPLEIKNPPAGTESLVLIVEGPDEPAGAVVRWIVWNISPEFNFIKEGGAPEGAVVGLNDSGENSYAGPCPPPETTRRYFFKLYALNAALDLENSAKKADLEKAMEGKVIKRVQLMGLYASQ